MYCNKFVIYKNNCNLAYIFTKKKNRNICKVNIKYKIESFYQPYGKHTIVPKSGQSLDKAIDDYVYTCVYTQFSKRPSNCMTLVRHVHSSGRK